LAARIGILLSYFNELIFLMLDSNREATDRNSEWALQAAVMGTDRSALVAAFVGGFVLQNSLWAWSDALLGKYTL